jgi:hypothetical protein
LVLVARSNELLALEVLLDRILMLLMLVVVDGDDDGVDEDEKSRAGTKRFGNWENDGPEVVEESGCLKGEGLLL